MYFPKKKLCLYIQSNFNEKNVALFIVFYLSGIIFLLLLKFSLHSK